MNNSEIKSLANYLAFMYGIDEKDLIGNIATWNNTPQFCFDSEELLDLKLPVDVSFNSGTNKAGTTLRALAFRIKAVNDAQDFIDVVGIECAKQILNGMS